jgi:hypothetical protein
MSRYRFPGRTPVPSYCNKKPNCDPYTIIKACPPQPYIKDTACSANIYDRAVVQRTYDCDGCTLKPKFLLRTFSGPILCPINLDKFCGYDFRDGEVVAVEAEDATNYVGREKKCRCEKICGNSLPVKLFNIKRIWKREMREVTGVVSEVFDSRGLPYFILTEVTFLADGHPYFELSENSLLFDPIKINYEIFNVMSSCDAVTTLKELEGKVITATYVDYGYETNDRDGIPVVITDYRVHKN